MRPTPSVIGRFSAISRITLSSSPLSSATRSRKLSSKSISPRMARSVMAFTLSPTPARMASSSITSVSIRVESISKHTSRRQRRYMVSSWRDISKFSVADRRMNSLCIRLMSRGLPRTENSTQAFAPAGFEASRGTRPVRRCMPSIFSCCSAIIDVTAAIWRAVSWRPSMVTIQRFLPCIVTHSSYSPTGTGVKRICTLSSDALKRRSFIILPDSSPDVLKRIPSERV